MPNRLELPDDLLKLIEKRDGEDRRQAGCGPEEAGVDFDRRSGEDRRTEVKPEDGAR